MYNNENDNAYYNNQQQHDEQHQRQFAESHNNDYPCRCPGYQQRFYNQPYNSSPIMPEHNLCSNEENLSDVSGIFAIYIYRVVHATPLFFF